LDLTATSQTPVNPPLAAGEGSGAEGGQRLRLLSYNIQTGIISDRYRHYVTYSWKHLLPYTKRWTNLDRIAQSLSGFDLVGLQEVDSGSLRTGFINQTKYLADRAGFPFWHFQTNRRLGKLAQHANGLLSRVTPHECLDYKLPGLPGRGALLARFGSMEEPLALFILHLSLGQRGRMRQMAYLAELVNGYAHAVVMGDLNCELDSAEMRFLVEHTDLHPPSGGLSTFPSWRPHRHIDHILVTPRLEVERTYLPHWTFSDHLPIAMDVKLPQSVRLHG
jgi:endonuclease/exonuclease/phosphatase family metal-dependent hydrolase